MLSPEAEAFIEEARKQKPFFNSNFDPVALRTELTTRSTSETGEMIALGSSAVEVRRAGDGPAVLYVPGGGFCFGPNDTHRVFVDRLAEGLGHAAYIAHYRLAPENPFPAPVEDVAAAVEMISLRHPDYCVVADSAGAAIGLSALDGVEVKPTKIALISPLTDLALTGLSYVSNSDMDPRFGPEAILHKVHHYLQGHNPTDPAASPFWGELTSLPTMFIAAGSTEVMRDDAVQFAARARAAGADVILSIEPDMPHAFHLLAALPEAKALTERLASFLSR